MAGQLWNQIDNTAWYSPRLSRNLRMAKEPLCRFSQFTTPQDETHQGKHAGETYAWATYGQIADDSTYGRLEEDKEIPMRSFDTVTSTGMLHEYGAGVPWTGLLDDLSAQPVRQIIEKALGRHNARTEDWEVAREFARTPLRVAPTAGADTSSVVLSVNGSTAITNNVAFTNDHVKAIVDEMKERDIPAYQDMDYFAVGRTRTFRNFKNNLEGIKQYTDQGYTYIRSGEIGKYEHTRFIEQTHIPRGRISTANAAWANGLSDSIYFFGEDTVGQGVAVPAQIRAKVGSDFGRSKGIAWYSIQGFDIIQGTEEHARVIAWDSAA